MKAMIFAAGRGERMRPLTDTMPKPLLPVGGKPLIAWQIERLAAAGLTHIVINHAWLGRQFEEALGDGARFGVSLAYSVEPDGEGLETAGGIAYARHLLEGDGDIFLAVSGDIFTRYDYARLAPHAARLGAMPSPGMHLVMVPNPPFHPDGDFVLAHERLSFSHDSGGDAGKRLTFGNIGLYDLRMFRGVAAGTHIALSPFFRSCIGAGLATGELYDGCWENIGTPEQLANLDARLRAPGSRPASARAG